MSLTHVLEINRDLLDDEELHGLDFAEHLYALRGCPKESRQLCEALEEILVWSVRQGLIYPRILLLRKKQLERGTWAPQVVDLSPRQETRNGSCERCGGRGWTPTPHGTGSLCACQIRKARAL